MSLNDLRLTRPLSRKYASNMGQKVIIRTRFPSVRKTAKSFGVSVSRLQRIQKLMDEIFEGREGRKIRVVNFRRGTATRRTKAAGRRKAAVANKK